MDKVAFVSGASRNMGLATAVELGRLGARVVLNARGSQERLDAAVAEVRATGAEAIGLLGDMGDRDAVIAMVGEAGERFGGVDILIHTPAARPVQPFLEITTQDWRGVMATNLDSLVHAAQAVLPHMLERGWGRILGFSGSAAFHGAPQRAHVMASKSAVVGLVRGLALEYAASGITVNTVVPGPFETERATSWALTDHELPAEQPVVRKPPPVGRRGDPQEIAALCAFLASDAAGFITGQSLHINGGSYIG